jgi:hypothetical protein
MSRSSQIKKLYNNGRLAYSQEEDLFYDPKRDVFLDKNGYEVKMYLPENWKLFFDFKFSNGLKLSSVSNELESKNPQLSEAKYKSSDIVNFLVPGPMSLCSKTDNSTPHPTAHWEEQQKCTFAKMSIVGQRCMYWNGNLDGHCGCADAYAHIQGKEVDINKIIQLHAKDKPKEPKDLEKNFDKARKTYIGTLNAWYEEGKLLMVYNTGLTGEDIFYSKTLDVFFNGYGNFLESLTIAYRKSGKEYKQFIDEKLH